MASAAVYVLTALLAFRAFPLLPLGLSHRPYQVALHYPHFPPLASIIPHFSPLFFGRYFWTIFFDRAKPPQGQKSPLEDVLERELNESYLRHECSQHVTGRQAAGDLAQWHHAVFKI